MVFVLLRLGLKVVSDLELFFNDCQLARHPASHANQWKPTLFGMHSLKRSSRRLQLEIDCAIAAKDRLLAALRAC